MATGSSETCPQDCTEYVPRDATVAELARKSWEVAGILTKPEDWDGTEELKSQEEKERLAGMQARERERQVEWKAMTPEERQKKAADNSTILFGEDTDDPFADDVVEVELVVSEPLKAPPPEDEPVPETVVPMTLLEALQVGLPKAAPKMGLEEGTELAVVVQQGEKGLIEYLTKPSSYKEPSEENMKVQEAATIVLEQWDAAREVVVGEPEEMEVEEGQETPLF